MDFQVWQRGEMLKVVDEDSLTPNFLRAQLSYGEPINNMQRNNREPHEAQLLDHPCEKFPQWLGCRNASIGKILTM